VNLEKTNNKKITLALHKSETLLKASKSNTQEALTSVASDFGSTLFTFKNENLNERKNHLLSLVTPSLSKKMFDPNRKGEVSDTDVLGSDNPELASSAVIKDSVYNWTGSNSAKVILTIEQTLSAGSDSAKTIYEVTVNLINEREKWNVTGFVMKEVM
jgi:hypothetical protein